MSIKLLRRSRKVIRGSLEENSESNESCGAECRDT